MKVAKPSAPMDFNPPTEEAGLPLYKFNEIHNNYNKYKSKYGIIVEDIQISDMEQILESYLELDEVNGTDDELDFEN